MKTVLTLLLIAMCIVGANAQKKFNSDLQAVENSNGTNFNRYKAEIEFDHPMGKGQYGKVQITLTELGSSVSYKVRYVKKTQGTDGVNYWFSIVNNGGGAMFNGLKLQEFEKPILKGKYKYCFVLLKYDADFVPIYEHSYFSNLTVNKI